MVYRWKDNSPHPKVDAQVVGEHLEMLRSSHGGITARLVVDEAKAEDSPLHEAFQWDDSVAADEWRLQQARQVVNHIVVVMEKDGGEAPTITRAFVVVTQMNAETYTSVAVAMADPGLRAQVVARALRELEAIRKKYAELEELAEVFRVIDQTQGKLA